MCEILRVWKSCLNMTLTYSVHEAQVLERLMCKSWDPFETEWHHSGHTSFELGKECPERMCLLGTTVLQLILIGNTGVLWSQYITVDSQKYNMDKRMTWDTHNPVWMVSGSSGVCVEHECVKRFLDIEWVSQRNNLNLWNPIPLKLCSSMGYKRPLPTASPNLPYLIEYKIKHFLVTEIEGIWGFYSHWISSH